MCVAFVCAIDIELHAVDAVQIVNPNTMRLQSLGRSFRTGHGTIEQMLDAGQMVDEKVGSGTGADADNAVAVEMRADMFQGSQRHLVFQFVLIHCSARRRLKAAHYTGPVAGWLVSHRQFL
jgi:hypothetical protein